MHSWVHGSDADIGGTSTSNWALGEDGRAKFWGVMRLKVRPEAEGRLRGGYAGIRARVRSDIGLFLFFSQGGRYIRRLLIFIPFFHFILSSFSLLIYFFFVLQSLPTLFGPLSHDLTPYSYLALRLRLGLGIRDAWYINLRTSDMPHTDLWQHRLYFRGDLQSNYGEIRVRISFSSNCPFYQFHFFNHENSTQKKFLDLPKRSHLRISHTPAEASTLKGT